MKKLIDAATKARGSAHAPYSGFKVGAAVLDEAGRVHAGANVENASYPEGICAETAAIAAMVVGAGRRITAVAVVADGAALCTPCGGCRQRIREFAAADTPIHVAGLDGLRRTFTLAELLPESFGPENLA